VREEKWDEGAGDNGHGLERGGTEKREIKSYVQIPTLSFFFFSFLKFLLLFIQFPKLKSVIYIYIIEIKNI